MKKKIENRNNSEKIGLANDDRRGIAFEKELDQLERGNLMD